MLDVIVRIRMGETKPVYGAASASAGQTVTLMSATWSLYDADGNVLQSGQPVTGSDSGVLPTVRAWVMVSPALLALTPGLATLVIAMRVTGADGIARVEEASIGIFVAEDAA